MPVSIHEEWCRQYDEQMKNNVPRQESPPRTILATHRVRFWRSIGIHSHDRYSITSAKKSGRSRVRPGFGINETTNGPKRQTKRQTGQNCLPDTPNSSASFSSSIRSMCYFIPKGSRICGSDSPSGLSSLKKRLGWISVLSWYLSLSYSVNSPRMSW